MKKLLFDGIEELATGFGIVAMMAVGTTILDVAFGGWKGFRHSISILCVAVFMGCIASWICQYYGMPWALNGAIIAITAIFSNTILNVIFHPAVKEALVKRLTDEIGNRGRKERKGEKEGE